MALTNGNPLIDAETTLVGWTNRSAIRNSECTFLSGEEVLLNTKLDAASRFSLLVSHPGAAAAVEVELQLAPVLRDGTTGSWISAIRVALPAEGGRVEAFLSGHDIQITPADLPNLDLPAVCFAKALVTPTTPAGMHVGMTATIAA
ncbi:hypothetical protein KBZ14_06155 [Synechococcus sp. HJ21-Hayes]|uniref:hypothetical protein n=1 Tax=unclassified Synechococcus TaxID=2626047 RepID=UPI0020CE89AB|nr:MULTISPECIES: hypothetical protein [unclassified Synechococcus]MCP9831890.1 hypothetical protein [Synechococcus sp. JJ3a-Johnson]MCP9852453.1 hypothetical protein [Synechococcus sp. HJ21-Hayes]